MADNSNAAVKLFGRKKILTDEAIITQENVLQVLQESLLVHAQNSVDINELYNIYKGKQDILKRVKNIRPEICNKIVENRANEIVSFKTGYLCGEPVQYVSRDSADAITEGIGALNDMMNVCSKSARDKEIADWAYIAGVAHRMTLSNTSRIRNFIIPKLEGKTVAFSEDEAPFNIYTLDPRFTFVVYSTDLGEPPVMNVKYVQKNNSILPVGQLGDYTYSVYTEDTYYEIENGKITKNENNPIGLPIIEYKFNNARLGAFEIVLSMLNAINTVQSNRIDGIEQFIQSLIVLTNAEIDDTKVEQIRDAGLIILKSFGENKSSIEIIAEQLDQTQTQTLIDYMYQTILNIVGMPNRNGGSSTSDTGAATIVRDGWAAAEARAKDDETMFKEAERSFLKLILRIVRDTTGTPLNYHT